MAGTGGLKAWVEKAAGFKKLQMCRWLCGEFKKVNVLKEQRGERRSGRRRRNKPRTKWGGMPFEDGARGKGKRRGGL